MGKTKSRKPHGLSGIGLLLAVWLLALLPAARADAAPVELKLDDNWVAGSITASNEVDYYQFYVPSAGFVHIDYQGWSVGRSHIAILDQDLTTQYDRKYVGTSSDANPLTTSLDFAFEQGYYCAKVYPAYSNDLGDYRLKGSFTAAENNEKEPNDGFAQAMELGTNKKVTGFISETDRLDFYRIVVPSTQKIKITYNPRIPRSRYSLWDANYQQIYTKYVGTASEASPLTSVYEETLDAGIYYIKIEPEYSNDDGRYQLSWELGTVSVSNISINGNKELTPGKTVALTTAILPSNATDKSVVWSSNNTSVATVSTNGIVTAVSAGTAEITAAASDGSGVSASTTVTVTDPVKVASVKLSGNKKVAAGSSFTLKASVSPSNAANRAVTWSSSNKSVASVSSKGKVTTKKAGVAKITAKAKDGSGVSKTVTVIVKPKKMAAPTLANTGSKKLKISWKKQSGVSGYQIQYATDKGFENSVSKAISNKKSSVTLSGLKKKTYYVRIRACVKTGGKTYYGSWSSVKSKKVK